VSDLLQIAFSGLTVGAAYALVALGFAIVFRGMRSTRRRTRRSSSRSSR
jgi:branched-subunit amino acid ABC-type transport system permease component